MTKKVTSALVIGGGIAGPVVAAALVEAGVAATVHERSTGPESIGGALAIAPNGVAALASIGADHAVLDHAQAISRNVLAVGRRTVEMAGFADLPPLRMVWRDALHAALHKEAVGRGVEYVHGRQLVSAQRGRDGVTATFADGSTATADVLIGADGVHSTVRRLIDPNAPKASYTGMLGFGGLSSLDVGDPDTMTFAFGKQAYYLYWGTEESGTLWGANLPRVEPLTRRQAQQCSAEEWLGVLDETYGDDDPGAALVRTTDPASMQITGALYIMPSVPHWHGNGMVLVGDAAHAPSNSSGQGASLAIESSVELARCLRDLPDAESAFAAYERLRRARVEGVAARAARINHAKTPGPVGRAVLPVLMPVFARLTRMEQVVAAEQAYRIDWDATVS